jgi:hypothetical protein
METRNPLREARHARLVSMETRNPFAPRALATRGAGSMETRNPLREARSPRAAPVS